jgi:hypothetical protein
MNPLKLLREAVKAVPAVKFALGVAGIAAVVAIVLGFRLEPERAVFGALIVLALMFVLAIFSRFASKNISLLLPAKVLVWFYTSAVIVATTLLITGYFFQWPPGFSDLLLSRTRVEIVQPNSDSELSDSETVYGRKGKIANDRDIWVLVRPSHRDVYYPVGRVAEVGSSATDWVLDVCIPQEVEDEAAFTVYACPADQQARRMFHQYGDPPCGHAIDGRPPDATECASRTFYRKKRTIPPIKIQ